MSRNIFNQGNNVYVNTILAQSPLEIPDTGNTQSTINMGGLTGFEATKGIACNAAGDGFEYVVLSGDTTYTPATPISISASNVISLDPDGFADATTVEADDSILLLDGDGSTFEKIPRPEFKEDINYGAVAPLSRDTTNEQYKMDFSSLSTLDIDGLDEFLIRQNSSNTFYKASVSSFSTFSAYGVNGLPLVKDDTNNEYEFDIVSLSNPGMNSNDVFLVGAGSSNTYQKRTMDDITAFACARGTNFGTESSITGTRTFGNIGFTTAINGESISMSVASTNDVTIIDTNFNQAAAIGSTINTMGTLKNLVIGANFQNHIALQGSSGRVMIGKNNTTINTFVIPTALHVCNTSASTDNGDSRMSIESRISTKNPGIDFVANTGTNAATTTGSITFDSTFNFNISADDNSGYLKVNNNFWSTGGTTAFPRQNYFANLRSDKEGSNGLFLIWGTDIAATSGTHGWKIDVGGGGDLHFKYNTNVTSITSIKGYIATSPTSNGLMNFTGQHRCIPEDEQIYDNIEDYVGMVVEATGLYNSINVAPDGSVITITEPTVNESQPIVKLTTSAKSKKVYGVISAKEDGDSRNFSVGVFNSSYGERTDNRLFINSVGEGGILVCNENGNIENGDLLCSSSISGIAMKQTEEYVANFTIGKATMDYNFTDSNERKLIGICYYCG